MTWLFIEPADVWFFRDGRPFVAGEGHTAQTTFPPSPLTVQGALRSLILSNENVDWEDFWNQRGKAAQEMGKRIGYPLEKGVRPASLGQFKMQGPFVGRWVESGKGYRAELLTPLPLDTFYRQADEKWQALQPKRQTNNPLDQQWTNWSSHLHQLSPPDKKHSSPPKERGFLNSDGLDAYLQGEPFVLMKGKGKEVLRPFVSEPRLGIAINYDYRHAADQMLYQSEFTRPQSAAFTKKSSPESYGLLVKLDEAVTLPASEGVMGIGGEARAAHYRLLSSAESPQGLPSVNTSQQFKLVLQTPAWFTEGWQPTNGQWSEVFKGTEDANVQCVAVAVGRPLFIGGWDVANNGHKAMRSFVPAGSVYYFTADQPIPLPEAFTQTPNSDLPLDKQGFGAFASGAWDWLD
jgi:CRISPR-associated protein Cmr3